MGAIDLVPELLDPPELLRHRLTVDDYYRMAESGVLAPDARVELIEGEVIDMAPMGSKHYWAMRQLDELLRAAVSDQAVVTCQLPLRLSNRSEPVPDFCVVSRPESNAAKGLPSGEEAWLVIEVSDSTLSVDARIKAPMYAAGGVGEYWVVDLQHAKLHRFTEPKQGRWTKIESVAKPGRIPVPRLIGAEIDLASLF
jgi:Uma2 family endonuclease